MIICTRTSCFAKLRLGDVTIKVVGEPLMTQTARGLVDVCQLRVNVNLKVILNPQPSTLIPEP